MAPVELSCVGQSQSVRVRVSDTSVAATPRDHMLTQHEVSHDVHRGGKALCPNVSQPDRVPEAGCASWDRLRVEILQLTRRPRETHWRSIAVSGHQSGLARGTHFRPGCASGLLDHGDRVRLPRAQPTRLLSSTRAYSLPQEARSQMKYNPNEAPIASVWLATDETERLAMVLAYHKRKGIDLPNPRLHAAIHMAIENQLAEGMPEARETLARLIKEGLNRHDAVHALGSVLANRMYEIGKGSVRQGDPNAQYIKELKSLSAESWRGMAS